MKEMIANLEADIRAAASTHQGKGFSVSMYYTMYTSTLDRH